MTFTRLSQLAELTTITEVGTRLLLESHNYEGYSELSRKGDIYAVQVNEEGAIEFAVVKSLSPFILEGITGSTTNLMSRIASDEIEVLGRLTRVEESFIIDISSLRERQLMEHEDCETCQPAIKSESEVIH